LQGLEIIFEFSVLAKANPARGAHCCLKFGREAGLKAVTSLVLRRSRRQLEAIQVPGRFHAIPEVKPTIGVSGVAPVHTAHSHPPYFTAT
jgi:hypothetical protein